MWTRGKLFVIAAIALLGLLGGCAKGPDDAAIANDIKAKIFSDPDLKAANVEVAVKDGVVTLSGEVPSADSQLKLYKLAQAAPGAVRVEDQLRVVAAVAAEAQTLAAPVVQPSAAPVSPPPAAAPRPVPAERGKQERPAAPPPAAEEKAVAPQEKPVVQPPVPHEAPAVQAQAPAAPQPVTVEIPVGSKVAVRMVDAVDSAKNKPGELFLANLDEPIQLRDGHAIPRGTDIYVKLVAAKSAGKISGTSELELQLSQMEFQGKTYRLASTSYEEKGKSRTKETATRVGIGTGVGAAIGAIAGGGKGAAIGAAIGGGGATAVQVLTRGQQVKVPSETQLVFELEVPVAVTFNPVQKAR